MVTYTPGFVIDHWCAKGHLFLCLEGGELQVELKDGHSHTLKPGMSFQVSDNDGFHFLTSPLGAKVFIVD